MMQVYRGRVGEMEEEEEEEEEGERERERERERGSTDHIFTSDTPSLF